jgi:hypothetical protein
MRLGHEARGGLSAREDEVDLADTKRLDQLYVRIARIAVHAGDVGGAEERRDRAGHAVVPLVHRVSGPPRS